LVVDLSVVGIQEKIVRCVECVVHRA
jgi:hypothetical protein